MIAVFKAVFRFTILIRSGDIHNQVVQTKLHSYLKLRQSFDVLGTPKYFGTAPNF